MSAILVGGAWVISHSLTLGVSRALWRSSGRERRAPKEQGAEHRIREL